MNARLSYREAAVPGASPVRLVILLYEQAVEDLRRATEAHARGDIEGRTRDLNHAIVVIGHLQGTLDHERGGHVATNLERFYNQVRASLVDAQCRQSLAAIEGQILFLMQMHEAWCEVERASKPSDAQPLLQALAQPLTVLPSPTQSDDERGRQARTEWNA